MFSFLKVQSDHPVGINVNKSFATIDLTWVKPLAFSYAWVNPLLICFDLKNFVLQSLAIKLNNPEIIR